MTAISLTPLVGDTIYAHPTDGHLSHDATVHRVPDCSARLDIDATPITANNARTIGVKWCRLSGCWPGNRCAYASCGEPSGERALCGPCERADIAADVARNRAAEHTYGEAA